MEKNRKLDPADPKVFDVPRPSINKPGRPFSEDDYTTLLRQTPDKNLNDKDRAYLKSKGY